MLVYGCYETVKKGDKEYASVNFLRGEDRVDVWFFVKLSLSLEGGQEMLEEIISIKECKNIVRSKGT